MSYKNNFFSWKIPELKLIFFQIVVMSLVMRNLLIRHFSFFLITNEVKNFGLLRRFLPLSSPKLAFVLSILCVREEIGYVRCNWRFCEPWETI